MRIRIGISISVVASSMPFNLKYKYILNFTCTECNHSSFIRRLCVKCWHKLASTHQCIELCGTHDQYLTDDCSKSVPLRIIRAMCYVVFFCLRFFFLFNQYHRPWTKININQSTVQCANSVWCTINNHYQGQFPLIECNIYNDKQTYTD